MKLRLPLCLGFVGALALVAGSDAAEDRRPNVLVIVADDLGYGELSCQGNPQIPTPNIDSLAKGGIRFTSGYVSGPYCSPTRAGLLTGRYQQRFGHEFNPGQAAAPPEGFGLSLKEKPLPEILKGAGYATGMFGKWHLGNKPEYHPTRRGFESFFGFLGGAHSYIDARADGNNPIQRGTDVVETIDYTTEAFAREAVAFIDRHKGDPWFVYLPFNAVHSPLQAPQKYLDRFAAIDNPKRKTFAAMLTAMDDAIGSVLAKLRELDLEKATLIVFISDNGGPTSQITSKNDPLRGFKAQVWEGGIRVPFMIQWKGRIPAGKVDDRPVIQLDIFPTVLAATGVSVPSDLRLDGVNLLPYLTGEKEGSPHEALFWRFGWQHAVRKGDWKLTNMGENTMLFNLAADIGETTDLAAKEPAKVAELEAAYKEWDASNVPAKWGGPPARAREDAPAKGKAKAKAKAKAKKKAKAEP